MSTNLDRKFLRSYAELHSRHEGEQHRMSEAILERTAAKALEAEMATVRHVRACAMYRAAVVRMRHCTTMHDSRMELRVRVLVANVHLHVPRLERVRVLVAVVHSRAKTFARAETTLQSLADLHARLHVRVRLQCASWYPCA